MLIVLIVGLFFQAEDGVRDLPWSGGVGDVCKRQALEPLLGNAAWGALLGGAA